MVSNFFLNNMLTYRDCRLVGWRAVRGLASFMALCGLGFGFFQAPNNRALMLAAPIGRAGGAAGMQAIARHSGQIFGAIVVAALFAASRNAEVMALGLGAGSAALAAAASFSRLRRTLSPAGSRD